MGLKTKLALAVATSAAGAAMIAGGTFAEFYGSGSSTGNTFTAGTLHLAMNPNSAGWGKDDGTVGATWVSPLNWAPGQSFSATLQLSDTGNIGAKHVYFTFGNAQSSDPTFLNEIDITKVTENFNGTSVSSNPATLAAEVGDNSGTLTLADLMKTEWYTNDANNDNSGYVLQPNNKQDYSITFEYTFDDNAGNQYQGATASFDLGLTATQNSPTDGMKSLLAQ